MYCALWTHWSLCRGCRDICSHIVDLIKLSLTRLTTHVLHSYTEDPYSTHDVPAYSYFYLWYGNWWYLLLSGFWWQHHFLPPYAYLKDTYISTWKKAVPWGPRVAQNKFWSQWLKMKKLWVLWWREQIVKCSWEIWRGVNLLLCSVKGTKNSLENKLCFTDLPASPFMNIVS